MVQVRSLIDDFLDMEYNIVRNKNDTWYTNKNRADYLIKLGYVELWT